MHYLERTHHIQKVWRILKSSPHATLVAGFKKWHTSERCVLKGECGIPILAPILVNDDEEKKLVDFRVVFILDAFQFRATVNPEPNERQK